CEDIEGGRVGVGWRLGEAFGHRVAIGIVERDGLAFEVAEIAQPVAEGIPPGRVVYDADTRDLRLRLRARRQRPCHRRRRGACEQRDELPPTHADHGAFRIVCTARNEHAPTTARRRFAARLAYRSVPGGSWGQT